MPTNQKRRSQPDPKKIMVIYGRNREAKDALFTFLHALHLEPLEWGQLIAATGSGSPYIGGALEAGFASTQAAVVLLTPDDEVRLRRNLYSPNEPLVERQGSYQPRPNVLIEAGMALGIYDNRTIFVQIGEIRPISDIAGRHVINFTGDINSRNELAEKLRTVGCEVFADPSAWRPEDFPIIKQENSESVIAYSHLVLLSFAKLIHHNFQELDSQGFQKIGRAVRTLFQRQSEGDRRGLVKACEVGWADSKDTQTIIQKNILDTQEKLIHEINGDDGAFSRLWTTDNKTAARISSSFSTFDTITKYLNEYLNQITAVSRCFDSDGNLDIANSTSFIDDPKNRS